MADNEWASEDTQQEIKRLLEKMLGDKTDEEIEKRLKQINKNFEELNKINKSGYEDIVKNIDLTRTGGAGGGGGPTSAPEAVITETMSRGAFGGEGGGGGPIGKIDEKQLSVKEKVTKGLFNFSSALTKGIIGLVSFTTIIGAAGKYLGDSIDGYRELIGVGQELSGSMLEMRKSAAEAGMGFDTFLKVMTTHSATIKKVGTGEFISLQKSVRKMGQGFGQFGLTVEGTNEFLAGYLEQSIRFGNYQAVNEQQRTLGFKTYMNQLTALSKATGKSREELAKSSQGIAENANIRMAMNKISKAEREEFSKTMKSLGPKMAAYGSGMTDLISDAIGSSIAYGNIGMSDLGKIAAVASKETGAAMTSMIKRIQGGGDDASVAMAELADLMRGEDYREALGRMEMANDGAAKSVSAGAAELFHMSDTMAKKIKIQVSMSEAATNAAAEKLAKENAGTNALLEIQNKFRDSIGILEKKILNLLTPAIEWLGDKFVELVDNISPFINWIGVGIDKMADFLAPFEPLVQIMGIAAGMFGLWQAALGIGAAIQWVANGGLIAMAASVWANVAGFLALAVPVLAAAAPFIALAALAWAVWDNWDMLKELPGKIFNYINEINWTKMFTDALQGLFDFFTFLPRKLLGFVADAFGMGGVKKFADDPVGSIVNFFTGDDAKNEKSKIANANPVPASNDNIRAPDHNKLEALAFRTGGTAMQLRSSQMTDETRDKVETRAEGGDKTAEALLKYLERKEKRDATAEAQRTEQIKQAKNKQASFSVL